MTFTQISFCKNRTSSTLHIAGRHCSLPPSPTPFLRFNINANYRISSEPTRTLSIGNRTIPGICFIETRSHRRHGVTHAVLSHHSSRCNTDGKTHDPARGRRDYAIFDINRISRATRDENRVSHRGVGLHR